MRLKFKEWLPALGGYRIAKVDRMVDFDDRNSALEEQVAFKRSGDVWRWADDGAALDSVSAGILKQELEKQLFIESQNPKPDKISQ